MTTHFVCDADSPGHNAHLQLPDARSGFVGQFTAFILIIYWGNPGTLDTDKSVKNVLLALNHPDRVSRMTVHMSEESLRNVLSTMDGPFPMLETLQLYSSTYGTLHPSTKLPSVFEAPNLRHLQVSDLKFLPPLTQLADNVATRPSIVAFTVGEITTKPETLMACLAL
jgi:hypothetical protein